MKKTPKVKSKSKIKAFLLRHIYLILAVIALIVFAAIDVYFHLFPESKLQPLLDSLWNMFEAQVGISAVGLTIVSLIISIVSTTAYGMSLPEFIMKIQPRPYLKYEVVIVGIIVGVVVNWIVLTGKLVFIAIYVFILTSLLAVYLTRAAMKIIYVRDDIKKDVREHILKTKLPSDIDNLYKAMAKSIKAGEYLEFLDSLEVAQELLSVYIEKWNDPDETDKSEKPKTYGEKFADNLRLLIDSAVDADNSKVSTELMEFYYNALKIANDRKNPVCIEYECFTIITEIFKVVDFEYLENIKINRECTYKEFLEAQLVNHQLYIENVLYNKKSISSQKEMIFTVAFYWLHYRSLALNTHKDKIDLHIYYVLLDLMDSEPIRDDVDSYKRLMTFHICLDVGNPDVLAFLYHVYYDDETFGKLLDGRVLKTAQRNQFLTPGSMCSLSKDLHLCMYLYRAYDTDNVKKDFLAFAKMELTHFYGNFFRLLLQQIRDNNVYHNGLLVPSYFKYCLRDFRHFIDYGSSLMPMDRLKESVNKLIVFSVITITICTQTASNTADCVDFLRQIFGDDEFFSSICMGFFETESTNAIYSAKSYGKFFDCFGYEVELSDRSKEINDYVKVIFGNGILLESKTKLRAYLSLAFNNKRTIQILMKKLDEAIEKNKYSIFENALVDADKEYSWESDFTKIKEELKILKDNHTRDLLFPLASSEATETDELSLS
jgi:hypothetical protein